MEAYITGLGIISPQLTFSQESLPKSWNLGGRIDLRCIEPDYKIFLDPMAVRRLSRMIKMGLVAGLACAKDANIEIPDAIVTGTALGCYDATAKFLYAMYEDQERFLTPTQFIQSTGNTISAQIAMMLNCKGYNHTYVHKGFSFESAVLDGLLLITEGAENVLIGCHEEQTDQNFQIYDKLGYWKKTPFEPPLWKSNSTGTISGEGSSFFMFSKSPGPKTYARIRAVKTIYKPENQEEIKSRVFDFLNENKVGSGLPDLVLYGINGDSVGDQVYHQLSLGPFAEIGTGYFKHLSGEYQTATGFALWLATMILHNRKVPEAILMDRTFSGSIQNILIYNHYRNDNHSLMLVSAAN